MNESSEGKHGHPLTSATRKVSQVRGRNLYFRTFLHPRNFHPSSLRPCGVRFEISPHHLLRVYRKNRLRKY